ncbi:hypothetical protein ACJX0J_034424, partial [Zea mays]
MQKRACLEKHAAQLLTLCCIIIHKLKKSDVKIVQFSHILLGVAQLAPPVACPQESMASIGGLSGNTNLVEGDSLSWQITSSNNLDRLPEEMVYNMLIELMNPRSFSLLEAPLGLAHNWGPLFS